MNQAVTASPSTGSRDDTPSPAGRGELANGSSSHGGQITVLAELNHESVASPHSQCSLHLRPRPSFGGGGVENNGSNTNTIVESGRRDNKRMKMGTEGKLVGV